MYPEELTKIMRLELTNIGFKELKNKEEVESAINTEGTSVIMVNSVCGCSGGSARPGLIKALDNPTTPDNRFTVFAGADIEATEQVRSHFTGYEPSSPSIAIMKDKRILFMMERKDISGKTHDQVSEKLVKAFNDFCR